MGASEENEEASPIDEAAVTADAVDRIVSSSSSSLTPSLRYDPSASCMTPSEIASAHKMDENRTHGAQQPGVDF